jgi:predicted nucleic acid-binding protein
VTLILVTDACSIMNFAAVDRMALLETLLRDRARYTQAVEGELRKYSNTAEFRLLKRLLDEGWLGEAIELDGRNDPREVEKIRAALGGVAAIPLQHMGEAESIRAILTRKELSEAIFLTDDGDAAYLADHRGITVKDTRWLLADAYAMGDVACPEPYDILKEMWAAGRNVSVPDSHKDICP